VADSTRSRVGSIEGAVVEDDMNQLSCGLLERFF